MLGIDAVAKLQLSFKDELPNGYAVFTTRLGPVICGRQGTANPTTTEHISNVAVTELQGNETEKELFQTMHDYLQNETSGLVNATPQSIEDDHVLKNSKRP